MYPSSLSSAMIILARGHSRSYICDDIAVLCVAIKGLRTALSLEVEEFWDFNQDMPFLVDRESAHSCFGASCLAYYHHLDLPFTQILEQYKRQ